MKHSIFFSTSATLLCVLLFIGCILLVHAGKALRTFLAHDDQEPKGGAGSLLGALFGLWGFVLAITFGNVSGRFETVRATMVEEANLIRTVILRTETLPHSLQAGFREDLKKYLQARIDYYEYAEDQEKFNQAIRDAKTTGNRLWTRAVNASNVPTYGIPGSNMLASLSAMYDLGSRRDALLLSSIPGPISYMLFIVAMVISFIGGFTSPVLKTKEWVPILGFILLATVIIHITLDMARPMRGFIKPDTGQEKIVELKEMF